MSTPTSPPAVPLQRSPSPLGRLSSGPVGDPIALCAEYVALGIIRRRGLTARDAEHLADLPGLSIAHCARLTRVRDLGEFTGRCAALNAITTARAAVAS